MNLGMSKNLDMESEVDNADTLDNEGVWTFDPDNDGRTGFPYLETKFSKPSWVTAFKITPLQEELNNKPLKVRLEFKTSQDQSDWSLLLDGDNDSWQVSLDETARLPRYPKIEVNSIRLTLLDVPYHTNERQVKADYFGCTLGGEYGT